MMAVPDWTTDGLFRRLTGRPAQAPPAPKSLIYVLCEEYGHFDLWAAYHAFRLDPQARTWQRLRRRSVPWRSKQTVEGLVQLLCPWSSKRTPDPNSVGLALVTAPSSSATPSSKKR